MITAQITFGGCGSGDKLLEEKNLVEEYLGTLIKNGQLYGEYVLTCQRNTLIAFVYFADSEALLEQSHSELGKKQLGLIVKHFEIQPKSTILEEVASASDWQSAESFYLFTHLFDSTSPVCHGKTGKPIPTYKLPVSDSIQEGLYFWAESYRHHDAIWLESGVLEIPAYKQLADPHSGLARQGRELCTKIEQATGKATFYYLHRYWGRKGQAEENRLCPVCGCRWHVGDIANENGFWVFPFRCYPCRLVSHKADSFEDERHARIGEYRET